MFISYSHKDSLYAHHLAPEFDRYKIYAWIDDRIDYGEQWPDIIQKNIDACNAFIVVMSEHSKRSLWVKNELAYAQNKGKRILPLLLNGDAWLSVATIQYIDVRNQQLPGRVFFDLGYGLTHKKRRK